MFISNIEQAQIAASEQQARIDENQSNLACDYKIIDCSGLFWAQEIKMNALSCWFHWIRTETRGDF